MSDFIKTDVQAPQAGALETWFVEQLKNHGATLLAFADDGVIWGRLADGILVTAPGAPVLCEKTIQQAFVFGEESEVRLFRDETGNWKALRVMDAGEWFPESQILWGDKSEGQPQDGFLHVSEYRSGIPDQFVPVDKPLGKGECIRLDVHHLVEYDPDTGEARIAISRLAGLRIGKKDDEVVK
jgi:CRISPR-associated protein (TIGR03984 family)